MSSFITSITGEIESYIKWTTSAAEIVFQFITFIGKLLLHSIFFLLNASFNFCLSFVDGLFVFFHELVLFLQDISDVTDSLFRFLSQLGNYIVQAVLHVISSFEVALTHFHTFICDLFDFAMFLMVSTLSNVKGLLILTGNSTLFLVRLGPELLFSLINRVTSTLFCSVQVLGCYIIHLGYSVYEFLMNVHHALADIPATSLLGLLLAVLIYFFVSTCIKTYTYGPLWQKLKDFFRTSLEHASQFKKPRIVTLQPSPSKSEVLDLKEHSERQLLRQLEQEREEKLCVICHDRFKCVILLPCRHFCLCQPCVQTIEETDPNCPLCRHYVINSLKVYS